MNSNVRSLPKELIIFQDILHNFSWDVTIGAMIAYPAKKKNNISEDEAIFNKICFKDWVAQRIDKILARNGGEKWLARQKILQANHANHEELFLQGEKGECLDRHYIHAEELKEKYNISIPLPKWGSSTRQMLNDLKKWIDDVILDLDPPYCIIKEISGDKKNVWKIHFEKESASFPKSDYFNYLCITINLSRRSNSDKIKDDGIKFQADGVAKKDAVKRLVWKLRANKESTEGIKHGKIISLDSEDAARKGKAQLIKILSNKMPKCAKHLKTAFRQKNTYLWYVPTSGINWVLRIQ